MLITSFSVTKVFQHIRHYHKENAESCHADDIYMFKEETGDKDRKRRTQNHPNNQYVTSGHH